MNSPHTPETDFNTFLTSLYNIINYSKNNSHLSTIIKKSILDLERIIEIIGYENCAVTSNGGKESIVAMYLFFTALFSSMKKNVNNDIQCVISSKIKFLFFDSGDNFPEVLHYLNFLESMY